MILNSLSEINITNFRSNPLGRLPGLLIFKINNYEFCVDHQCIKEIVKFTNVDAISKNKVTSEIISPQSKYTLVNIHGILEFPNVLFGSDSRLILIDVFGKKFGFVVDKIIEIIAIDKLFMDKNLDFAILQEETQRFSGVLKFKNRRIMMLNLGKITREFDKVIEFPRKIKTSEYVDAEIKKRLKHTLGIS